MKRNQAGEPSSNLRRQVSNGANEAKDKRYEAATQRIRSFSNSRAYASPVHDGTRNPSSLARNQSKNLNYSIISHKIHHTWFGQIHTHCWQAVGDQRSR